MGIVLWLIACAWCGHLVEEVELEHELAREKKKQVASSVLSSLPPGLSGRPPTAIIAWSVGPFPSVSSGARTPLRNRKGTDWSVSRRRTSGELTVDQSLSSSWV